MEKFIKELAKMNSVSFKITPPGGAVKSKKFIKEQARRNSMCFKITLPGGAVERRNSSKN